MLSGNRALLVGPNDTGKTTTLTAIRIGLFGFDPDRGPKASLALARGDRGHVRLKFDGRTGPIEIVRKLRFDGAQMKTEDLTVIPSKGERSDKEFEARISAEIGLVPGIFSPGTFLALTAGKRAEFLARFSSAGQVTNLTVFDRLRTTAPISDELARKLRAEWQEGDIPTANLARWAKVLSEELSATTAQERAAAANLKSSLESRMEEDSSAGTARSLVERRDELRKELETIAGELAADTQAQEAQAAAERAVATAETAVAASRQARKDALEQAKGLEALRAELANLTPPVKPEPEQWDADPAVTARAEELRKQAESYPIPETLDVWPLRRADEDAKAAVEAAKSNPWREAEVIADELDVLGVFAQAQRLRSLATVQGGNLSSLIASQQVTAQQLTDALAIAQQAERDRQEALAAQAALREEASKLLADETAELARLRAEAQASIAPELARWKTEMQGFSRRSADLGAQIRGIETALADTERRLDEDLRRQDSATRERANTAPPIDREMLAKRRQSLDAQVKELDSQIAAKERARVHEQQRLRASAAAAELKAQAQGLRKLQGELKAIVAQLLEQTTGPVLEYANRLLHQQNPHWSLTLSAEGGGLEIMAQLEDGAPPIAFAVLGGGRRMVFLAALSLALVRLQSPGCEILTLDVAEMDATHLGLFLTALDQLGGMNLDNVLVATCHPPDGTPEGWQVIPFEAPASAESQLVEALS